MCHVHRHSLLRTVLLLGLLLFPALLPMASANASQHAQRIQAREVADQTTPDTSLQPGGSGNETGDESLVPVPTGAPALILSWPSRDTHVGVPTLLTIQAVDGEGQPDSGVNGAVLLDIEDPYAQVYAGQTNPVSIDAPEGEQLSGRQRFTLELASGRAAVSVLFGTAGSQVAFATLERDIEIGGQSDWLQVHEVFFRIDGPATGERG